MRARPGGAALVVAAGVTLLAVFGVVACRSRTAPDVGTATVTALVSPSDRPLAPAVAASVPVSDGRPARDAGAGAPARLRVPALELDAPVAAVGIDPATGEVDVPEDVGRVGWYRFGPGLSATAGSIVVAGHVDSARQGRGAFFRLGSLTPGDRVTLTGPGGASRDFEVVARERYAKTAIPLQRYFARDGSPRLTLITCGGPFDAATRHYRDNVVVTAVPR